MVRRFDQNSGQASKLISSADLRAKRATETRSHVESRWYYAKKAVAIFPGVNQAIAPSFLRPYYKQWESELTAGRRMFNRATLAAYRAWIPGRTKEIADRYGLDSAWQLQAKQQAHRSLIDPHELAIFRVSSNEHLDACLRRFEWARINRRLAPQYWTPDCRMSHKIDFYLHAMKHSLPIPTMRAVVQGGQVQLLSIPERGKLVGKPESGRAGDSVFILEVPEAARSSLESMHELLANDSRLQKGDWVIQDHISPHHALAGLAMNALPTVRLITMLDEEGMPEILVTYLRFPSDPHSPVDNFAVGGMMGLIDQSSGILQRAVIMRDLADHETHPVTEEPIAGVQVPFWSEACNLVRKAHGEAFADYRLVGWDIGITDDGPVIIEGNAKPCTQGAQQVQRGGLGTTRFGELISWHLAEVERATI